MQAEKSARGLAVEGYTWLHEEVERRASWDPGDSWDPLAPGVPLGVLGLFGAPEARQPEFMHVGGFA